MLYLRPDGDSWTNTNYEHLRHIQNWVPCTYREADSGYRDWVAFTDFRLQSRAIMGLLTDPAQIATRECNQSTPCLRSLACWIWTWLGDTGYVPTGSRCCRNRQHLSRVWYRYERQYSSGLTCTRDVAQSHLECPSNDLPIPNSGRYAP